MWAAMRISPPSLSTFKELSKMLSRACLIFSGSRSTGTRGSSLCRTNFTPWDRHCLWTKNKVLSMVRFRSRGAGRGGRLGGKGEQFVDDFLQFFDLFKRALHHEPLVGAVGHAVVEIVQEQADPGERIADLMGRRRRPGFRWKPDGRNGSGVFPACGSGSRREGSPESFRSARPGGPWWIWRSP